MDEAAPSTNASEWHNPDGTFKKGHKLAKGGWSGSNTVREFRKSMLQAVTFEEIKQLTRKMLELAMEGDVAAAKELFLRLCGPAEPKEKGEGGNGIHILMLDGPHPRYRRVKSIECPEPVELLPNIPPTQSLPISEPTPTEPPKKNIPLPKL